MPVRNCRVIRNRAVVPKAYIQAPLFGAGWLRKRASHESTPVRSSTHLTTDRPASAVRDPILPIALIASTSSPVPRGLPRSYLGVADTFDPGFADTAVPADSLAGGQIAGHVLDAVPGLVAVPTEYPHVRVGVPQAPDDVASERTGAAGDQDE